MAAVVLSPTMLSAKAHLAPAAGSPCADIPHADHPRAFLTNGTLDAQVFLPDAKVGYYRGSRFDWSGVVPCLAYKGHTYFGEWFGRYDPLIADSITGPVEEFRSGAGGIGYDEAKMGETFVKIGVGVLRKLTDEPYKFMTPYPLVDSGSWRVKVKGRSVVFTQTLKGPKGVAYVYTKTLRLDGHGAVMTLEHSLKNIGTATIDTEVYDHDFYMIDKHLTGPPMAVHFAFPVKAETPLGEDGAIQGRDLVYGNEVKPRKSVTSYLTGYSEKASDYDFTVENRETKVGVQQTSDTAIARFNFWSIATTICPEAYVHLVVAPGKTGRYAIHYRFFADGAGRL